MAEGARRHRGYQETTINDSKAKKIMSQTQTAPAPGVGPARPRGRGLRGNPALTLLAVALGVMMVGIDGTIVAVANPAIQSHLHASLAGIQWVSNAYLLALAVSLITAGKLGDRFGHKKVFLTGVVGFAASSAAVGLVGEHRRRASRWSSRSARPRACSGPCCSRPRWPCCARTSRPRS